MSKILEDILAVKPLKSLESSYVDFDFQKFESFKIPVVTVHGRFQPPIHKNHFDYVSTALRIAEKVRILITNPEFTEAPVLEAPNRSKSESNPFTYKERVAIFRSFFKEYGVPETKFEFRPFNITDPGTWNESLDKGIPNLINIYGSWSERKLQLFKEMRYPVIRSNFPPRTDVSGTKIRTIIFSDLSFAEKEEQLIEAGYMPQAIAGLFAVLKNRQNSRSS